MNLRRRAWVVLSVTWLIPFLLLCLSRHAESIGFYVVGWSVALGLSWTGPRALPKLEPYQGRVAFLLGGFFLLRLFQVTLDLSWLNALSFGFSPWGFLLCRIVSAEGWLLESLLIFGKLAHGALWVWALQPRPQSQDPANEGWSFRGYYLGVLFGLACLGNLLCLPWTSKANSSLGIVLGIVVFFGVFLAAWGMHRSRVQRIFEPDDPAWVRRWGYGIIIYSVLTFVGGFALLVIQPEVIKKDGGYVLQDKQRHDLGPATQAQYEQRQRLMGPMMTAFMMMFVQFMLVDYARGRGLLPAWNSSKGEDQPPPARSSGPTVGPPVLRTDWHGSLEIRTLPKMRLKTAASGLPMLVMGGIFFGMAYSFTEDRSLALGLALLAAALPAYMFLVILFFAVYPGPVAKVSPRGLWLIERGWIDWKDMEKLSWRTINDEESVRIFVHEARRKKGGPWIFALMSGVVGLMGTHFASMGVRGFSVEGETWVRYAWEAHGVRVVPRSKREAWKGGDTGGGHDNEEA